MAWQRQRTERRHRFAFLICALFLAAFVGLTWWVHGRDGASQAWWEEVKEQLQPKRLQQRLRAARLLQDARNALDRGDLAKAEQWLKQVVAIDPRNHDAWSLLVLVLARQNRLSEAEALAAKIQDQRAKAEVLLMLADLAYLQREWAKAERFYEQVLQLDPNNATALNNYGYMLAELGERLEEAEKMIRKALQLRPNEPAFLDSLGWVYYQRGNYREARRWIEEAVKGQPNDAELRYHLGMVYWKLGEREKALRELRHALRLNPNHPQAREALEQLEAEEQEREMRGETIQT